MKPISTLRVWLIVGVTILAIAFTIPTVRYYVHLKDQDKFNTILATRPAGPPPPEQSEVVAYTEWKTKYADLAKWIDENPEAVAWEKKEQRLRDQAIPLGLDLLGGVDVVLTVDPIKVVRNQVDQIAQSVRETLDKNKITVTTKDVPNQPSFTLTLANKADNRKAANLLDQNFKDQIEGDYSEAALAAGPVTLSMPSTRVSHDLAQTMEGVRKAIDERVNALGVVQPRISKVGDLSIRIQVPGVKDPDRLIKTVIKPAQLEFRLVHASDKDLVDQATGKLKPGAQLPPGTELIKGRLVDFDKETNQLKPTERDFVLNAKPELTGRSVRAAQVDYDSMKMDIVVDMVFDSAGASKFAEVTTQYTGRQLAIMLDGFVRSAPNINEPIRGGRAQISGGFTNDEAYELAQILKAGALPADLEIESQQTVGASLGGDSIVSGVKALVIGTIVVSAFMIIYYGWSGAGTISILALILNVLIILAIMAMSRATLTLSGIGGILLTIGMAVDANVLIYERIREELANGRPMRQAIGLGFNRAFSVILDSNLTTLLTALVLLQFTEGSVKGFALTMTFGLLANLFTGLTVTYTLCAWWFGVHGSLNVGSLTIFKNPKFDFIGMRKYTLSGSWALVVICAIYVISQGGMKMGVDFSGGLRQSVTFTQPVKIADVRDAIKEMPDARVQEVIGKANTYLLDVGLMEAKEGSNQSNASYTQQELDNKLAARFTSNNQPQFTVTSTQLFGAETASGFARLAITVVILSAIAIGIYLWFRFELVFGVAAVIALVHDLLLVALICTIWNVQISLDAVAAFMVLMGFSVNDTIVIFDRIRENTRSVYGKNFGELCNLSMNQSLSRTIITSGTVFLAALVLLIVGGEGLASFAKIIVVGTIFGTYSSDFIAAPLVYMWNNYKGDRLAKALAAKKGVQEAKPIGRPSPRTSR